MTGRAVALALPLAAIAIVIAAAASSDEVPLDVCTVVGPCPTCQDTDTVNGTIVVGDEGEGVTSVECPDVATVSPAMATALSFLPIVFVFYGILVTRCSSKTVAPLACALTIFLGFSFFGDADAFARDTFVVASGRIFLTIVDRLLWTIFEYAASMGCAMFFLEVIQRWGVVEGCKAQFRRISLDPLHLLAMVVFCFGMLVALVAPGGSNYVIAGAIFTSILGKVNVSEGDEEADRMVTRHDERHGQSCSAASNGEVCHHLDDMTVADKVTAERNNRVAAILSFASCLSSAFNLLGVMIVATVPLLSDRDVGVAPSMVDDRKYVEDAERALGGMFSFMFIPLGTVSLYVMGALYSPEDTLWGQVRNVDLRAKAWPFLSTGAVFAVVQWLTSAYVGPELPCVTSGGIALVWYLWLIKQEKAAAAAAADSDTEAGRGGTSAEDDGRELSNRWMIPFALLVILLAGIRLIPGLEDALSSSPALAPAFTLGGYSKVDFPYLVHPGVLVAVVALLTPLLVPFRDPDAATGRDTSLYLKVGTNKTKDGMRRAFRQVYAVHAMAHALADKANVSFDTKGTTGGSALEQMSFGARYRSIVRQSAKSAWKDTKGILFSIGAFSSLAKLMALFGMTQRIALSLVSLLRDAPTLYAAAIPVIGMLGSFLTGSTTTSSFLFAQLQAETAVELDLVTATRNSVYEIGAAQILGASAGEIISPFNALVIVGLMKEVSMTEADLVKALLPVGGWWLLATMVLSLVFIAPPGGFIDPFF